MSAAWTIITDAITVIIERSYDGGLASQAEESQTLPLTYQRTTAEAVNQEPRNERSQEEPGVQESRHETGKVFVEAETLLEQGAGVVYTICQDPAKDYEKLWPTYRLAH
jgi:hypothetical protein